MKKIKGIIKDSSRKILKTKETSSKFQHENPLAETPLMDYFKVYPGFDPGIIKNSVDFGSKGIIIEGYHSGTACTEKEHNIIPALEYAKEKKVPIFLIFGHFVGDEDNHCGYSNFENKEGYIYGSTAAMLNAGIIPLKVNYVDWLSVIKALKEVIKETQDYNQIIQRMMQRFPFKLSIAEIKQKVTLVS